MGGGGFTVGRGGEKKRDFEETKDENITRLHGKE
jgi:hypothetical protein